MSTLKIYWLRASVVMLALVLGVGLLVKAMDKKDKVETKVKTERRAPQTQWFSVTKIDSSNPDEPSNFQITSTISAPPTNFNLNDCTQANTSGKYCAFALEFDSSQDEESVVGLTLEEAMDQLNAQETGHARNPSLP